MNFENMWFLFRHFRVQILSNYLFKINNLDISRSRSKENQLNRDMSKVIAKKYVVVKTTASNISNLKILNKKNEYTRD